MKPYAMTGVLLLACVGATVAATSAQAASLADSPCVAQQAPASDVCAALARTVSHDINTVRDLGQALEAKGRFRDAAAIYDIALQAHPNHRDLLQRLIYTRGQALSAALIEDVKAPPTATTVSVSPQTALQPAAAPVSSTAKAATGQPSATPSAQPPSRPATAPTAARERNFALIVGNERYAHFTSLRSPLADAQAIAQLLERDYGFSVRVLTNATRYQMVSALSKLRQEATERDNVLVYYAGHGYLDDTTSRGYWLPVDAEADNVANWLSTSDVTDMLAGVQARHALILADSCFSGALLRSAGGAIAIDERGALLRKLASQRSRTIMTSGGLEPVVDNGAGRHSVFAEAMLTALRENRDTLEAGRLFMQIRDRVALRASQTPQYAPLRNAGHDGGDFIFTRVPAR